MKYLILCEKPSAARNFAAALGGNSGFLPHSVDEYSITASHGHLLELVEPAKMVPENKVSIMKNWSDLDCYPWNLEDFTWDKHPKKDCQKDINAIKSAATGMDAIIIATDNDPSGEGDLLGWEIINAIYWSKKVYRIRFAGETPNEILEALDHKVDVTNQDEQGELQEALARERFDFASMQLSRIALINARNAGYNVKTQRLGRLKSVIIGLIHYQDEQRKNYVKKPFYEIRFQDSDGHKFTAKDADHFANENLTKKALTRYKQSKIAITSKQIKHKEPDSLLNLSKLSVQVGKQGYQSKQVLSTYQKMYEDQLVSYPRTEDKKVTQGQFNELLPFTDNIAAAVGINADLLTHKKPRTKFITTSADHGANRPGTNVPDSLATVEAKYGSCGRVIYEILAKSYLATLGEDFVYQEVKANLTAYPTFTSTIRIPKEQGYKDIFNSDKKDEDSSISNFSDVADPFIFEGQNPKPAEPSHSMVINYLNKNNIGTGATQESTLAEITNGNRRLIINTKEKYHLSDLGLVQAVLCRHTEIAAPKVTLQLQDAMKKVKEGKLTAMAVPRSINQIVTHDLQVIKQNSADLSQYPELGKARAKWAKENQPAEKISGNWNGQKIKFKATYGSHTWTQQEQQDLLAGKTITFKGNYGAISGKLAQQTYKGHEFVGFLADPKDNDSDDNYIVATFSPTGKNVKFKNSFGGHEFTEDEIKQLCNGDEISFQATSKAGKSYTAKGKLKSYTFKGKKHFGFKLLIEKKKK